MTRTRLASLALAAAGFLAPLAFAGEVVLYSSNSVDAINAVAEDFNKKYPDIKITPVRGSTGQMMQRIKAEAGAPKADIFWSGGFSSLRLYKEFFTPYQSPEAAAFQAAYREPANLWVGTNAHVMVIMVNKRALKGDPGPKSWSDLAHPRWKDRLVIGDPEKTSSSFATLWGIQQSLGKKPVEGIAKNATVVSTASQVYEGVAKGEFAVGMTMEYAAQEYVAGGNKDVEIVYPSEGTFIAPEGMALVKGGPNPADAREVLRLPRLEAGAGNAGEEVLPPPDSRRRGHDDRGPAARQRVQGHGDRRRAGRRRPARLHQDLEGTGGEVAACASASRVSTRPTTARRSSTGSTSRFPRASSSRCSDPPDAARRRCFACSRASSPPTGVASGSATAT
jgi:iron(III) transport system substrate-binding protein